MRRTTIGLTVAALVLSACGGGDDDDANSSGQPAADEPAADEPAADEPAADPAADSGDAPSAAPATDVAENTAVVTIGDHTYTFDVTPAAIQRCDPDFFGAFWVLGRDTDNNQIELMLPPPGDPNFEEPPNAKVGDEANDIEWVANSDPEFAYAGVEPGGSQVDSFIVDGRYVSGAATFIDINESYAFQGGVGPAPTSVTGTFEVLCAEE